jgi:hypothetical protein
MESVPGAVATESPLWPSRVDLVAAAPGTDLIAQHHLFPQTLVFADQVLYAQFVSLPSAFSRLR